MGQYYNPVIIDDQNQVLAWLYSHDFNNGLKLMEHSYVGNPFVGNFESLLIPGAPHHKGRVVWAGDYADYEGESELKIYNLCEDGTKLPPIKTIEIDSNEYPFIVNHTKKQYVDKRTMIKFGENEDWQIHPLPLLTCEGNGRGGGDYHPYMKTIEALHGKSYEVNLPNDGKLIGSWARDVISVEKSLNGFENFKRIKPRFREDW
jgi:hypothetical protein